MQLGFDFTFDDLYDAEALKRLDMQFQGYLHSQRPDLLRFMMENRGNELDGVQYSQWLIETAIVVESFINELFAASAKDKVADELAIIYKCNDRFVRKRALNRYDHGNFNGREIALNIASKLCGNWTELRYAEVALQLIDNEGDAVHDEWADIFMQYAAWAVHSEEGRSLHKGHVLFMKPKKLNHDNLFDFERDDLGTIKSPSIHKRKGFGLTDDRYADVRAAGYNANYCIFCHKRSKDSCSRGMESTKSASGNGLPGCALKEKISEMNYLKSGGNNVGALAVVVVDNPMCAGTGYRICNDCSHACIYQKQEPVDIPLIETNVLDSVLNMPFGFEIYSLLTRWNPLNLLLPYPKAYSGKRALVVGMGPAGYTIAHYLLNEGHVVVGVDGNKIEPLSVTMRPIRDVKTELFVPLEGRLAAGFGGVAEYGITVRWNKNFLHVIRLLLERRERFLLRDGMIFGSNIMAADALKDFDHIVLSCGAGRPRVLNIPGSMATGVRYASDFLMNLQLGGVYRSDTISNLQVLMPVVVIGGGLTAVDAATEVLAYYGNQVKKFYHRHKILTSAGQFIDCDDRERGIISTLLNDVDVSVTLAYRGTMIESPAYKLNPNELNSALAEGVRFVEEVSPKYIEVDKFGDAAAVIFAGSDGDVRLPAKTVIISIGSEKNPSMLSPTYDKFFCNKEHSISALGDLNHHYCGSVVKAMASAKDSYRLISDAMNQSGNKDERSSGDFLMQIKERWSAKVQSVQMLSEGIVEILVHAPLAARGFRPGQFYKLQNYELNAKICGDDEDRTTLAMESLALTGSSVCDDTISLIVLETGGSANLCRFLKPGEEVYLMGPTGAATYIPKNETVVLVGGGLGNVVAFSIGAALKQNGCRVIYFAGYRRTSDRVKVAEIEKACDVVVWACDETRLSKSRKGDHSFHANVIEAIKAYPQDLQNVDRLITIGSCGMMHALQDLLLDTSIFSQSCAAVASINSPMQCMLKGLCGQCLQTHSDNSVVFSCCSQDQNLRTVDFDALAARLRQNSVQEKLCALWINRALSMSGVC